MLRDAIPDRRPHLVGGVAAKVPQHSDLAVESYDRLRLDRVVLQSLLHDVQLVVLPLTQRLARYVVLALCKRVTLLFIGMLFESQSCYITINTSKYFIIRLDPVLHVLCCIIYSKTCY